MENKSLSKSLRKKPNNDTKSLRLCKSTNSKRHMTNDGEKNSKFLKKDTTTTEEIPELSSALPQSNISSDSFPRSAVKQSNDFEDNKDLEQSSSLNSNMKTENVQALTAENSPVTKENIILDQNKPSCSGMGRLSNFENLKSHFSTNSRHNKLSIFGCSVPQTDKNGKDLNNPFPQNESKSGNNFNSFVFGNIKHSFLSNSNVKVENAQALTENSSPISNKVMIPGENESFCSSTTRRLPTFQSFKSIFSSTPENNNKGTFKHSVPQADNNGKVLNNILPQKVASNSSKNINTIFSGNALQKLETNGFQLFSKLAPSASIVPTEHSSSSNSAKLREKESSVKGGFENNAPIISQDISMDQVSNEKSMIKTEITGKATQGNASFSFTQDVPGAPNLNKTSEMLNLQRSDLHSANNQLEMFSSIVISHLKQLPLENSLFCQKVMLETVIEERLKVIENEKTTSQKDLCGKNKKDFLLVNKLRLALLQLKDV